MCSMILIGMKTSWGFKNVYDSSAYQDGLVDYAVLRRQNIILHLHFQYPKDMTSTDVKIEVKNIDLLIEELYRKRFNHSRKSKSKNAMERKRIWPFRSKRKSDYIS